MIHIFHDVKFLLIYFIYIVIIRVVLQHEYIHFRNSRYLKLREKVYYTKM